MSKGWIRYSYNGKKLFYLIDRTYGLTFYTFKKYNGIKKKQVRCETIEKLLDFIEQVEKWCEEVEHDQ
jgi:hypothetical protein